MVIQKISPDLFIERYGLQVRLANIKDAEFITTLRTHIKLSRFISSTSQDVEQQRQWLLQYKQREQRGAEYYFIIQFQGNPIGTFRLYNIEGDKFTSGSWVFSQNSPTGASILGDIICREIAFEDLGLKYNVGDVRKDNKSVLRYNLSYHPLVTGEDDQNIYLEFSKEKFNEIKLKHIAQCSKLMQINMNEGKREYGDHKN